jgi:dihydroorotase
MIKLFAINRNCARYNPCIIFSGLDDITTASFLLLDRTLIHNVRPKISMNLNSKFTSYKRIIFTRIIFVLITLIFTGPFSLLQAQELDLLLKNGHVIDPKNGIDSKMDVAISNGKIIQIASSIPSENVKKVINVDGMYVTPGLIDIHVHAFWGTNGDYWNDGPNAVAPDGFTFRTGVTTIVDPGSMGWRTFPTFKKQTIDQSRTRVLAMLNIVGSGMRLIYEQDTTDMDPKLTARAALMYKDHIVGIKTAHYWNGFEAVDRTIKAGSLANMPVMVDFGDANPPLSLKELLINRMRPGDIYTHCYSSVMQREHIVDKSGRVNSFVFEAQKRGVIFEVGFGGGSLGFNQLIPSMNQGFFADVIGTDLHIFSMNAGMKSMGNVMAMFLSLGMPIQDVILRTTWNPAKAIKREDLGHLSPGADADISVFKIVEGNFGFQDAYGKKFNGTKQLEFELTLLRGIIEWNLNGLGAPMWDEEPIIY